MTAPAPVGRHARISLAKVRAHPSNPRMELGDLSELSASIRDHGLQQPIQVYPSGGGYFTIVDGHRRFAACVLGQMRAIDALIVPERTTAQVVTTMLATGVHSRPLSLAERQRAVLQLLGEERLTVSQIAAECGVSAGTVYRWRAGDGTGPAAPRVQQRATKDRSASGRPPVTIRVTRVSDLLDRWRERVDNGEVDAASWRLLLDELQGLTQGSPS